MHKNTRETASHSAWFCVLAATFGLAQILELFPFQHDDSYITYRYASNLLEHGVWAFNPAGAATEGFSTPLWLFLGALTGLLIGTDAIHWAGPAFGTISYLALIVVAFRVNREDDASAVGALSALCLALSPTLIYYTATGMETLAFAALIAIVALAIAGKLHWWTGAAAAALAAWTRPEAPWIGVTLVLALPFLGSLSNFSSLIKIGSGLAAGMITLLLWRYQVFGDILPNTYHAKSADYSTAAEYIKSALKSLWFWPWLLMGIAGGIAGRSSHRFYLLAGLSWMLAAYLEGGDWMPMGRFLAPAIALFCLATAGLLARQAGRPAAAAALVIFIAVLGYSSFRSLNPEIRAVDHALGTVWREDDLVRNYLLKSGSKSVALVDIGRHAYLGNFDVLDLAGLTDREIGQRPGKHLEKTITSEDLVSRGIDAAILRLAHMPELNPDNGRAVINATDLYSITEARLFSEAAFHERYRLARVVLPAYARSPLAGVMVFFDRSFPVNSKGDASLPATNYGGLPVFFALPAKTETP